MAPIDDRSLISWIGIMTLVVLVSTTGMLLNRYLTHRTHRKALEEWRLKAVSAEYRVNADDASTHSVLKNIQEYLQE